MSLGVQTQQVPNFTPQQMKLFRKLLGNINNSGGLEAGIGRLGHLAAGSQEGFEELEKPAYSDFQKQLGQIGTRFSGLGAQGSSAFQNATSGAATDLTERLQAQRMAIQNNALNALLGQSNALLGQRAFDTIYQQPDQGFDWGGLLGGIGGSFFGPLGGGIGSGIGRLFG
jgi:hypothetical protein